MDYESLSRTDLIERCRGYSESLHKLVNECFEYRCMFGSIASARRLYEAGEVHTSRCHILPTDGRSHRPGTGVNHGAAR